MIEAALADRLRAWLRAELPKINEDVDRDMLIEYMDSFLYEEGTDEEIKTKCIENLTAFLEDRTFSLLFD